MERTPSLKPESMETYSEKEKTSEGQEEWPITQQVRRFLERNQSNGDQPKRLGVTWSNLTVKGVSNDAVFNENVLSQFNPFGKGNKGTPLKTIIHNSSGCVKPGGMSLGMSLGFRRCDRVC